MLPIVGIVGGLLGGGGGGGLLGGIAGGASFESALSTAASAFGLGGSGNSSNPAQQLINEGSQAMGALINQLVMPIMQDGMQSDDDDE